MVKGLAIIQSSWKITALDAKELSREKECDVWI